MEPLPEFLSVKAFPPLLERRYFPFPLVNFFAKFICNRILIPWIIESGSVQARVTRINLTI